MVEVFRLLLLVCTRYIVLPDVGHITLLVEVFRLLLLVYALYCPAWCRPHNLWWRYLVCCCWCMRYIVLPGVGHTTLLVEVFRLLLLVHAL